MLWTCGLTAICLFSLPASAQIFPSKGGEPPPISKHERFETRFLAGIGLGGSLGQFSGGIPMVYRPICNHLEEGSGVGYSAGVTGEYLLSRSLSLSINARYGSQPGSFERLEPVGSTRLQTDGEIGHVVVRINSAIDYQAIQTDLLLKWTAGHFKGSRNGAGVAIGPSISLPLKGTMTQEHLLEVFNTGGEFLTQRDLDTYGGEEISSKTLTEEQEMTRMERDSIWSEDRIFPELRSWCWSLLDSRTLCRSPNDNLYRL